ncbi:MAG: AAA family ATPase, partial [Synergistaceae bacterium]|nr:AAA family ATPase [Synergistaceae bacterium]
MGIIETRMAKTSKSAKKTTARYRCSECGSVSLAMVGRCPDCGEWGTMTEEAPLKEDKTGRISVSRVEPISSAAVHPEERISSGIEELDRVLGGGWINGGVALLGGEPGVGKSTLLLQACAQMANAGR